MELDNPALELSLLLVEMHKRSSGSTRGQDSFGLFRDSEVGKGTSGSHPGKCLHGKGCAVAPLETEL